MHECNMKINRKRLSPQSQYYALVDKKYGGIPSRKKQRLITMNASHSMSSYSWKFALFFWQGRLITLFMLISRKMIILFTLFSLLLKLCINKSWTHKCGYKQKQKQKHTNTARSFSCSLKSLQSLCGFHSLSLSFVFVFFLLSLSYLMCRICTTKHFAQSGADCVKWVCIHSEL